MVIKDISLQSTSNRKLAIITPFVKDFGVRISEEGWMFVYCFFADYSQIYIPILDFASISPKIFFLKAV